MKIYNINPIAVMADNVLSGSQPLGVTPLEVLVGDVGSVQLRTTDSGVSVIVQALSPKYDREMEDLALVIDNLKVRYGYEEVYFFKAPDIHKIRPR